MRGRQDESDKEGRKLKTFRGDECAPGLHVGTVNDWRMCQPHSCGVGGSQAAEDGRMEQRRKGREASRY